MRQFLIDHLEGCTPAKQCASCRGMAFLKANLTPEKYHDFVKILEETTGRNVGGSVLLTTRWDQALPRMSFRTTTCLKNDNIVTLADILRRTRQATLRMPNFGKKSMKELEEALATLGLYFGMHVPDDPPTEQPKGEK